MLHHGVSHPPGTPHLAESIMRLYSLNCTITDKPYAPVVDNLTGNITFLEWKTSNAELWKKTLASIQGLEGLRLALVAGKGKVTDAVVKELILCIQTNNLATYIEP